MLGRETVKGQQLVTILDQAFRGLRVFCLEGFDEQIEGGMCVLARFCLPDVMQHFLGLGLAALGQVIQNVACFVHPTALLARGWEHFFQCGPEPHGPVSCCQL